MGFFLMFSLIGCSSSDKKATAEGVAALQKMSLALQDMEIVVSGGVTLDEYSQRLTDAHLKFGSPESLEQVVAKFPKPDQRALATQACQQLALVLA